MEIKETLFNIRKKYNLSQKEMAERLMITRQAISRWENGETSPNIETLKIISKEFNIPIGTLFGSPVELVCHCCGMPMHEYSVVSKNVDGYFNENYCRWCYADGEVVYNSFQELMEFLVPHMASLNDMEEDDVHKMLCEYLPKLNHWKQ